MKKNEKTLTMAAAKAGMSRKTARKYLKSGKLPSQCQPERYWRTRSDPFESVWPEVKEILKRSPTVEAKAVFDHLCRQQEGAFQQGQLRTLQRRIKQWKAEYGEAKEVMFPQKYQPGHQAQSDFTFMGRLGVTIQGQPFPHLLYHFVLAYSNWEATTLCFSESFESLSLGLQNALWELGALPEELPDRPALGGSQEPEAGRVHRALSSVAETLRDALQSHSGRKGTRERGCGTVPSPLETGH